MKTTLTLAALLMGTATHADTITVAGGCFWCTEADFEKVQGVSEAVSGFAGGSVENPTYEQVVDGGTGHYEAVQIEFDPAVVDRRQLYDLFFRSIDPLDDGGQFCDRGESYRTAIWVTMPKIARPPKPPRLPPNRSWVARSSHRSWTTRRSIPPTPITKTITSRKTGWPSRPLASPSRNRRPTSAIATDAGATRGCVKSGATTHPSCLSPDPSA